MPDNLPTDDPLLPAAVMMTPLPELAAHALARDANALAIEFEGVWHSWGELAQVARATADLVDAAGVQQGAPIGFVARNHPATVAALLGLIAAGHTIQMIYAFQSSAALARDIDNLRSSAIVVMARDLSEPVRHAIARCGAAAVVLDGMSAIASPGLERTTVQCDDLRTAPQIEILTSGTTGPPKRFAISFDMIVRHHMGNVSMAGARTVDEADGPPFLLSFPLGNISGIYSTLPTLLRGQPVTLLERFSLSAWHAFILRYRPEASGLPPAGFQMLLDANIPPEDLISIKVMATGAAPLDPTVQRAFEDRYGIPILLSYGATEFGGPVAAADWPGSQTSRSYVLRAVKPMSPAQSSIRR